MIDTYLETSEHILTRIGKDGDGIYWLLDMCECLSGTVRVYDGVVSVINNQIILFNLFKQYAGGKGSEINDLLSTFKSNAALLFKQLFDEIKVQLIFVYLFLFNRKLIQKNN